MSISRSNIGKEIKMAGKKKMTKYQEGKQISKPTPLPKLKRALKGITGTDKPALSRAGAFSGPEWKAYEAHQNKMPVDIVLGKGEKNDKKRKENKKKLDKWKKENKRLSSKLSHNVNKPPSRGGGGGGGGKWMQDLLFGRAYKQPWKGRKLMKKGRQVGRGMGIALKGGGAVSKKGRKV